MINVNGRPIPPIVLQRNQLKYADLGTNMKPLKKIPVALANENTLAIYRRLMTAAGSDPSINFPPYGDYSKIIRMGLACTGE